MQVSRICSSMTCNLNMETCCRVWTSEIKLYHIQIQCLNLSVLFLFLFFITNQVGCYRLSSTLHADDDSPAVYCLEACYSCRTVPLVCSLKSSSFHFSFRPIVCALKNSFELTGFILIWVSAQWYHIELSEVVNAPKTHQWFVGQMAKLEQLGTKVQCQVSGFKVSCNIKTSIVSLRPFYIKFKQFMRR